MTIPKQIMNELGLEPEHLSGATVRVPPADDPVAKGLAARDLALATALSLEAALSMATADADLALVDAPAIAPLIDRCCSGAEVHRWSRDPRLVFVHAPGATWRTHGAACEVRQGGVVLFARGADSAVLIDGPGGSFLLVSYAASGALDVAEVESSAVRGLATWEPCGQVPIEAPAAGALIFDGRLEPWLAAQFEQRSRSISPVERVGAVGLIGRLWTPPKETDRDVAERAVLDGDGPARRALRWFGMLDAPTRSRVATEALVRADALAEELPDLSAEVVSDPHAARPELLRWLLRRDDLECVAFLFRGCDPSSPLLPALDALDRAAAAYHSMWSFVDGFDDERLRAVAWQQPQHWWGDLAIL
jgi:hypothetical protein